MLVTGCHQSWRDSILKSDISYIENLISQSPDLSQPRF